MTIAGESLIADGAMWRRQVVEQYFPAVLFVAVFCRVGSDGQQPGLETGALLEPCQVAYHRQPGILHHLVGIAAADNGIRHCAHGALIGVYQFLESRLLACEQPFEQAALFFAHHRHPSVVVSVEFD
ncbi:hypothetical protein D3C80_1150600 [compost metagenome]